MKKKTLIIGSLIIAAALIFFAVRPAQKPRKPAALMVKTERTLIEAVNKNPGDPENHYILGAFYLNNNRLDDAIKTFKEAIAVNAKHGPSLENLGLAYFRKKDYDNALVYLNKALKVIPDTATLHNTLGAVYHEKKQYTEALKAYRKTLELRPSYYSAYYNVALVLQDMKSPEAVNAWEEYIKLASKMPSEAPYVELAKQHAKKLKR